MLDIKHASCCWNLGYMAPEYLKIIKFTDNDDMYCFDVLLWNYSDGNKFFYQINQGILINWMRHVVIAGDPIQAVDLNLIGSRFEVQKQLVLENCLFVHFGEPQKEADKHAC